MASNSTSPSSMAADVLLDTSNIGVVVAMAIAGGIFALILGTILFFQVRSKPMGDQEGSHLSASIGKNMVKINGDIQRGAKAFLKAEYTYLAVYCVAFAIILVIIFSVKPVDGPAGKGDSLDGVRYGGCFIVGAMLSAGAGWIGMVVATDANVRTCYAAAGPKNALNNALKIAFAGGSVMGFYVVGLGIVGLSILFVLMAYDSGADGDKFPSTKWNLAFQYLTGFGFGASSIALFARVAGGIYTKAADVGADLVGKVEEDMAEDHPNNPAVIADNVGDNVGDVAGMGADLFESYVGSIIAAGSLATMGNTAELSYPLWVAGSGIIAAFIGSLAVRTKDGAKQPELLAALSRGVLLASLLVLAFTAAITYVMFGNTTQSWKLYGCVVIGLVCGVLIGEMTERFTSYSYDPVKSITRSAVTGAATVIIQGLGVGMLSTLPPAIVIVVTIIACDILGGAYGVAIAAVGMLSTLGVTLATDAYGPVADNAGGIAEMATGDDGETLPDSVRKITDSLDALGNTTAATGKGFAIGSAVLTALSLLSSFKIASGLDDPVTNTKVVTDVADPLVLGGLMFGAVLPFIFAALTMLSVRKAATSIIIEVRRQFRACPQLLDDGFQGNEEYPDYDKCIAISTNTSVEEMILPGGLAILTPLFIGFLVGPKCLAGVLAGAIATGFMLAVMMSNAGGAWDNAKKYIELEDEAILEYGGPTGKASDSYKEVKNACVVGDTVGDPFKDTSGPALNILIKLMSMVSLVFAPLMKRDDWATWWVGLIILAVIIILVTVTYCKFWKGFEEETRKKMELYDKKTEPVEKEQVEKEQVEMAPAAKAADPEAQQLLDEQGSDEQGTV